TGTAIAGQIRELVAALGLPGRLRDAGVPREELVPLTAATVHEIQGHNLATEDEVRALFDAAW
ncbi:MAG: hypothetical protein HY329_08900, partial [Chloroflexi bacterium]|nr:hypothetical protein [Chloroflexota bacterium]